MARMKRLKPRRKWTNRLAWAVWKIRKNNKSKALTESDNLIFGIDNLIFNGDNLTY